MQTTEWLLGRQTDRLIECSMNLRTRRGRTIVRHEGSYLWKIFEYLCFRRLHIKNFENLRFGGWVLKNLRKTLVPKVWLKILECFEIVSKNLRRFLKVYGNHRFNQVLEYATVSMVLIKNYMFGGDNCKRKLCFDMLPSQNSKIHYFGADTIPSKTFEVFWKPSKNIDKKYKNFVKTSFRRLGFL